MDFSSQLTLTGLLLFTSNKDLRQLNISGIAGDNPRDYVLCGSQDLSGISKWEWESLGESDVAWRFEGRVGAAEIWKP